MVNEKLNFGVDFDDSNFKSCFARSVAVNSLQKQLKSSDVRQLQTGINSLNKNEGSSEADKAYNPPYALESPNVLRLRKESRNHSEENRRFSCHSATNSRRGSLCSNRPLPNIPIENIFFQSQIDTLQWQLKQTEASREMYRAVMKQVVSFLERAHRSLELLGTRLNTTQQQPVHRCRSEHHVASMLSSTSIEEAIQQSSQNVEHNNYEDCTWRRPKQHQTLPEEVPPEKLSQEAYRLLRTAQSLLNTREPDLAHLKNDAKDDLEFISQLAKEFPQESKPQRVTSFSLSPKLLTPERDSRISTALNRKLSLHVNDCKPSLNKERLTYNKSENFENFSSLDHSLILTTDIVDDKSYSRNGNKFIEKEFGKFKFEPEKSNSPPVSSVGSAEDESGFSSMNSFQEVGLPIVNSTINEETLSREALLRSMLHTESTNNFTSLQSYKSETDQSLTNGLQCKGSIDDYRLWQKPDSSHKRSSSTPVETSSNEKVTMKVLWV